MLTPPTGWEGAAATLAELRASCGQLAAFLDRQWCELDSRFNELAERQRALDARERELARLEEDIAGRLQLVEVYKQLAEARCDLLRSGDGVAGRQDADLLGVWTRFEQLESEIASFVQRKSPPAGVTEQLTAR